MKGGDAAKTAEYFSSYETGEKRAGDGSLWQMVDDGFGIFFAGDVNIVGRCSVLGGNVVMRSEFFNKAGFQKQGLDF